MKPCAIYARVSTSQQADYGSSLDSQIDVCRSYANKHGYKIIKEVREDISGARLSRPGLDQLLELAQARKIQAIICSEVTRFSRDNRHFGVLTLMFEEYGVDVLFSDQANDGSFGDEMTTGFKSMLGKFERAEIIRRTQTGKRKSVTERNRVLGTGCRPFGYNYVKKQYRYEVVPEEAETVRLMYRWLLEENLSSYAIANRLNAMNIKTAKGKLFWNPTTVGSILKNPLYTGVYYHGKHRCVEPQNRRKTTTNLLKSSQVDNDRSEWIAVSGKVTVEGQEVDIVPALISQETHERALARMKKNRAESIERGERRKFYLLRGHGSCEKCGSALVGKTSHNLSHYFCYPSSTRPERDPAKRCPSRMIRAEMLENKVWEEVVRQLSDKEYIMAKLREHEQNRVKFADRDALELESIGKSEQKNKIEKSLLVDLLRDNDIDRETYNERLHKLRDGDSELSQMKAEVLRRMSSSEQLKANALEVQRQVELAADGLPLIDTDFDTKRAILDGLQIKVVVGDGKAHITGRIRPVVLDLLRAKTTQRYTQYCNIDTCVALAPVLLNSESSK